jgi:hypothetical protein
MNVNCNPTAFQQNMKKLPISKLFYLLPVSLTPEFNIYLFFNTTANVIVQSQGAHGILTGPGETDS